MSVTHIPKYLKKQYNSHVTTKHSSQKQETYNYLSLYITKLRKRKLSHKNRKKRRRKNLMRSRNKKKTHHMTVPYSKVPDMHSRAQWSLFNF